MLHRQLRRQMNHPASCHWIAPVAILHYDAGFIQRIMFGSDQMNWPEAIERAIDAIESASFLSDEQKRDILFNNAARFLRLSDEEIADMHGAR